MSLKIITAPQTEPLTLIQVKENLAIEHDADDQLLHGYIKTARSVVERMTGRRFVSQVLEYAIDCFPAGAVEMPVGVVTAITQIRYINTDGQEVTLLDDEYKATITPELSKVTPVSNWPTTKDTPEAVFIQFTVGADGVDNVDPAAVQALQLLIANYYRNREPSAAIKMHDIPAGFGMHIDLLRLSIL